MATKGFQLSADFQGLADAYSYGIAEYYYPTFQGSNFGSHWLNRWTPDNPTNDTPRLWTDNGTEYGQLQYLFLDGQILSAT